MPEVKREKTKKIKKKEPAKVVKKRVKPPKIKLAPEKPRFLEEIGRRKTSVAQIRLFSEGENEFLVNGKPYQKYFPTFELQRIVISPLKRVKYLEKFRILAKVKGGGYHSQAEAVRHGLSRALVRFFPDFRKKLKKVGYLTRDSRMKERKKFGLKRARRAPQWQKR